MKDAISYVQVAILVLCRAALSLWTCQQVFKHSHQISCLLGTSVSPSKPLPHCNLVVFFNCHCYNDCSLSRLIRPINYGKCLLFVWLIVKICQFILYQQNQLQCQIPSDSTDKTTGCTKVCGTDKEAECPPIWSS